MSVSPKKNMSTMETQTLEDEKQSNYQLIEKTPSVSKMETLEKLKTLTLKDDQTTTTNNNISFPSEIIQDILTRLPIKPLLQFTSVSKPWLSLISKDPSFSKLHFTRSLTMANRTSFFISAYDRSTNQRHFLTAPADGGPVTHFITLDNARNAGNAYNETTEAEHLNGLVLFTSRYAMCQHNFAFVVNPATRKVFKLPDPPNSMPSIYFFGFHESKNEHKILSISTIVNPSTTVEFMIFSLSTYSWRKICVEKKGLPPFLDIVGIEHSVCVNSVIHLMLESRNKLLAFDLTTEKFSVINLPKGALPRESATWFTRKGEHTVKLNKPFLINDNGLLGVVCHDRVVATNEMHVWVLQDYVNRVWVRETITFSESWIQLDGLERVDYCEMVRLVFSLRRLSTDMMSGFILDMKTKSFKLVNFNLRYQFLHSKSVKFHQVRSYVESILPLGEE